MNMHALPNRADVTKLEVVNTSGRLNEIGPQWTELWTQTGGQIFQSHAWIKAWWDTLAEREQCELRIGLIWRQDMLVAVIPLAITRRKGVRFLEWAAGAYSDYGDIIISTDCPDAALAQLWGRLCRARGFDLAFLNRLLPNANARRLISVSAASGVKLEPHHRQETSYRVERRWETGEEWLESKPKKIRQEYRRHLRILGEMGKIEFRMISKAEDLGDTLERLVELKRGNLAAQQLESAMFEDKHVLEAFINALSAAGILRFFLLECDGKIIAASLNFVQNDVMMVYVTTYDPKFSRGSPGDVLMTEYVKWSIDHGHPVIDFLCGAERFKNKFATDAVALESVLGAKSLRGLAAYIADDLRQKFRRVRHSRPASVKQLLHADSPEVEQITLHESGLPDNYSVLGLQISEVTLERAFRYFVHWSKDPVGRTVVVRDVHGIVKAIDDPQLARIHNSADMVTPDGMPLVWSGRMLGRSVSRTCGPDLMHYVLKHSARANLKHYFYGGKPGVAGRLKRAFEKRFPDVGIVGTSTPPFRTITDEELNVVAEEIRQSGAHIVWIGISSPKQEYLIERLKSLVPATFIGVGAAFDFHTGAVSRAPYWMQVAGLEWGFRLFSEPRRLWRRYLIVAPRFVWLMLKDHFSKHPV
jgi:exopolysaccharide biosynthesis WecB/TagA/CpsF family protein